jgi:serine/threonine protein phosphatase 1
MRHLAVGDIHGCSRALTTLAESVPFRADDVLITLGDYVNRGSDTRGVLDWLIAYDAVHELIPLRGNHEWMMLNAREGDREFRIWRDCGGDATLASYSTDERNWRNDIPEAHWEFLEYRTRAWYETDTHFFVHANAYPDRPLRDQPDSMLYWEPFDHPAPHESGKVMVCGHTSQKSGRPLSMGHAVCIDTWACGRGWLTCLDVQSGRYWQANQQGETREDWIET